MTQEAHNINNQEQEIEIDLRQLLYILLKRRYIIISFVVVLTTLALIYSFMANPVYRATSRIFIETSSPRVVKFEDVDLPDYRDAVLYLNSQTEILKSNVIARLVDEELGGYKPAGERLGKKSELLTDQMRLQSLLKSVTIKTLPRTQIIEISVEDIDPNLASKIANAWIYAYIAYPQESDMYLNKRASVWIEKGIERAKAKLADAEKKLSEYRRAHNLTTLEGTTGEGTSEGTTLLNELVKKRAELEVELAQQLNYFKEKHPKIIGLKSELKSIEEKIQREMALKEKAVEYTILKREVETSRALYESLMNRMLHSETVEGLKSNVKIVDEAQVPRSPIKPNKRLNVLLALFMGLFFGTTSAMLLESLDLSIKSPEDIKNVLGLSFLAIIPIASEEKLEQVEETDETKPNPALRSFEEHFSSISEAYRSLRTSILFSNPDMPKRTFLVTSSGPQEGKTTTATNLAIVMAQSGERILLIDADFRRPNLHNIFGVSRSAGITEVLSGKKEDFTSHIHHTDISNLDLLVCGSIPPNPSELLGSKKMEWLLQELLKSYDRVIFDTPPVLAATDAVVLSNKVELTLLVAKANYTHKNAALRVKELLNGAGAKIAGVVLNMVQSDRHGGKYYNYYYYYYYNYHYGRKKKISDRHKDSVDAPQT